MSDLISAEERIAAEKVAEVIEKLNFKARKKVLDWMKERYLPAGYEK